MQRFFVEPHQIDGDRHEIHITGSDVNHIVNVLRMKKDEELWISDKEKEYHCVIENAGEDEVLLHILYVQEPDYELQNRIYLFQGLPEVHSVMTFKEALVYAKELDVLLIPYELAKGMKETKELIRSIEPGKSIGVFIGPEGGFEEQEVADAMEAGAKPITLGHRILRTETAGLAVLSVLMFQLEDE